jgi:tetratricopeptide (TPR) repeat protein
MKRLTKTIAAACLFAGVTFEIAPLAHAADAPASASPAQLVVRDTSGANLQLPSGSRPCVIAFLRVSQPQTADALDGLRAVAAGTPPPQIVIVLSGDNAADAVQKFAASKKLDAPIVLDPDYAISGKLNVHVWPTTAVLGGDGTNIAHLAGMPASFASDLSAYLDFATQKIDRAGLDQRLKSRMFVTTIPADAAARHLQIANMLLEKGDPDAARSEIEKGLKLAPADLPLRLALVNALLQQKQFADALAAAESLQGQTPPWQVNSFRAEALLGLERWADARTAAAESIKLNPRSARAYYLSGMIAAHDKDFETAAANFKRAYESAISALPTPSK